MREVTCPKCMTSSRTNQEIKFQCKKCHRYYLVDRCLYVDEMLNEIWGHGKTISYFRA